MLSLASCNSKTSSDNDVISTNAVTQSETTAVQSEETTVAQQEETTAVSQEGKIEFKSADGKESLFAPESWTDTTNLNPQALIQITNTEEGNTVYITGHAKDSLGEGFSTDQFAQMMSEVMKNMLTNASVTEITDTTVNGRAAKYFEVSGELQNQLITYFITILESDSKYYQVGGITPTEKAEQNKDAVWEVINSFTVNE
jgi:hypothetical protein